MSSISPSSLFSLMVSATCQKFTWIFFHTLFLQTKMRNMKRPLWKIHVVCRIWEIYHHHHLLLLDHRHLGQQIKKKSQVQPFFTLPFSVFSQTSTVLSTFSLMLSFTFTLLRRLRTLASILCWKSSTLPFTGGRKGEVPSALTFSFLLLFSLSR